jgi:hypothetical protein
MKKTVATMLLAFAFALCAGPARAANPDATVARVVELNRQAVALYKKKKHEDALKLLRQALDLCEAAGLEQHPITARTHVHLGIVIVGGFGKREIGARQFTAALRIQPDIALTPGLASVEVEEAFTEAAVAVTPGAGGAAPSPEAAMNAVAAAQSSAPLVARQPTTSRRARADRDQDDDDDDDDDDAPARTSRLQLGALVGGGVGWASGVGDVNGDTPVPSSFAAAKLGHLLAEVGYWVRPSLMLSAQGRFQYVTGPTIVQAPGGHTYQPASGATALFGALTWSPAAGRGRLQPFVSGAVGGGSIRHVVTLSALRDCGPARNETCVDTVAAGPLLFGVGGGLVLQLGDSFGLVAAVNAQVGAPRFTVNVDFNGGVAFHL